MNCKVSAVVPTFRRPVELRQAMASMLSQGGVLVEVFVVDDSPEGSARAVVGAMTDARASRRFGNRLGFANRMPFGDPPPACGAGMIRRVCLLAMLKVFPRLFLRFP